VKIVQRNFDRWLVIHKTIAPNIKFINIHIQPCNKCTSMNIYSTKIGILILSSDLLFREKVNSDISLIRNASIYLIFSNICLIGKSTLIVMTFFNRTTRKSFRVNVVRCEYFTEYLGFKFTAFFLSSLFALLYSIYIKYTNLNIHSSKY